MTPLAPTAQTGLLRELLGRRLSRVIRWLYAEDSDRPDFEQDADGPSSLVFDSDFVLHVEADPERQGIKLSAETLPEYGIGYRWTDVSGNSFWKPRVGMQVVQFTILRSKFATAEYPMEFGLELQFENGLTACVEYVDTEEWPDTLRVRRSIDAEDAGQVFIE
jgi:hypothetical protein